MAAITKKLETLSEAEVREMFGDIVRLDEKILWQGGAFYSHRNDTKMGIVTAFIIVGAFEAVVITFAVVKAMLGESLLMPAIVSVIVALFAMAPLDSMYGVFYPRYYVITDVKMAVCYKGFFKKIKYLRQLHTDYSSVHINYGKRGCTVVVGVIKDEQMPFVISEVDANTAEEIADIIEENGERMKLINK